MKDLGVLSKSFFQQKYYYRQFFGIFARGGDILLVEINDKLNDGLNRKDDRYASNDEIRRFKLYFRFSL